MTDTREALEAARHAGAEAIHEARYGDVDGLYGNATFDANTVIDAFLSKLSERHCIVPREPNVAMFRALTASWPHDDDARQRIGQWALGSFAEDYRAMIQAASGKE